MAQEAGKRASPPSDSPSDPHSDIIEATDDPEEDMEVRGENREGEALSLPCRCMLGLIIRLPRRASCSAA